MKTKLKTNTDASAAASAACIYNVVIGGRFAPPYKYMVKYIQQKQQRQQHKNLLWQFIQLSIHQLDPKVSLLPIEGAEPTGN